MSIRTSLAWSFSQQFLRYGLTIIGSVVVARLLTPAEMGVFALAMAAGFLMGALRDFGVGTYLIREKELNNLKVRTAFGMFIVVSWTLGSIILLFRNDVASFYGESGIADVLLLISLNYFVTPFGQPANFLLRREMRFRELHHVSLACGILSLATTLTLAFAGFSFMALAWGFLASTTARTVLLLFIRPDHLRMLPSLHYWGDVVRFGGLVTAASFVSSLNAEGIKFVIGGFINPAATALFERGTQIPELMRGALNAPLSKVLLPAFSKSNREGVSIGSTVEKLVAVMTAIIWPSFLTIGLLAKPIIIFVFGENWQVAGDILPFMLLAYAFSAALPHPLQILVPTGKVKVLFWLVVFGALNNLTLTVIGASHSLMMFAYLQPVQSGMFTLAVYLCIRGLWQADSTIILAYYAKAAAIAITSAIPALIVISAYGTKVPLMALISVALTAPIIWLACVFLLRHPISEEILSLMSKLRVMRSHEAG